MKRFTLLFVSLMTVLLVMVLPGFLSANSTVVVEGVASSRDGALDRALRDAVRQGAGVDIDSISTLVATEEDATLTIVFPSSTVINKR